MKKVVLSVFIYLAGYTIATAEISIKEIQRVVWSEVNPNIERKAIPSTPNNMPLPEFGQQVIMWGAGPYDAKHRLETITENDVVIIREKGVTLDMIEEWQAFYDNETQRNPGNPAAFYRAKLMAKIITLW